MSPRKPCGLPTTESTNSFWHRAPSTLLKAHRSTRHLPQKADVVIVGSGITGASVAYHIFNRDHSKRTNDWKPDVVMLEAREACWGATGRNGGHCQPLLFEHPHDPAVGHFELKNYTALQSLIADKKIDCEFVAQPGVRGVYGQPIVEHVEKALSMLSETDPELSRYMRLVKSKEELCLYHVPTADAAIVTAVAGRLWPYKLVAHILETLLLDSDLQGHFNLQTLTPVDNLKQKDGRWLVQTSRGTIEAANVILATNAYTSHLLPTFSDLIVPCRGQMSALEPPAWLSGPQRLRTSLGFEGAVLDDYLIQRPSEGGEHLMFGGGRHLGPSLGVSDDSTINDTVAKYLRTMIPERLSSDHSANLGELKAVKEWTGIMAWSKDKSPWVGPVPDMDGVFVSAGYTGHGMPNAWLCGKAVVEMMTSAEHGSTRANAVNAARALTGLPTSYVLCPERIKAAQKLTFGDEQGLETHMQV